MEKIPGWVTPFCIDRRTLIVQFSVPHRVISSAVRGGGIVNAQCVFNHQVEPNPLLPNCEIDSRRQWPDPSRYLGSIAKNIGLSGPCVGLMTAVDIRQLVIKREQAGDLWVEGFFTVGTTNAVRAGEPVLETHSLNHYPLTGTINIILVTNASLRAAAMVCAVQVVTESKTAAVLAEGISSCTGESGATGTGTDAVVVASGHGPRLRYSGTHTKLGELIGRVVSKGVGEGLSRSQKWALSRSHSSVT